MRKSVLLASVAASLSLAACGGSGVEGPGAEAAASVRPDRVDAQELRAAATDERVKRFYEARNWEAAWTRPAARDLLTALQEAPRHGLDAVPFLQETDGAQSPTAREAALTLAAIAYAEALATGVARPDEVNEIYTLPKPDADVVAGLAQAIEAGEVGQWLAGLPPQDAEYRQLSEAYLQYRQLAAQGPQTQVSDEGGTIRAGDRDPRVPAIAEALRANGYLVEIQEANGRSQPKEKQQQARPAQDAQLYTERMAEAVARLQADYGIEEDGVVGSNTLQALNTGPADRARILAINLERRRWLDRDPPATRVDVNIPAAFMDYYHDGRHVHQAKVMVGTAETVTPLIGSPIFQLVANPTWTVPKSIAERDILPRGASYLASNNMTINSDGWIVQASGPRNALGQVKFDMKNDHAIFLHDTPSKSLFAQSQRQLSNGCVRVEDAVGFARMLASQHGRSTEFERALASGRETFVRLPEEIMVRMLYHTAYLDQSGSIVFRTDPYGWDEDLAQKLGIDARTQRRLRAPASIELGP